MNPNCKCGGRLRRTDIVAVYDPQYGRTFYQDTDRQKANWRCDNCGVRRTQRKRQSNRRK